MLRYLARKIVVYILTFFVAVTIDWAIPRFMPGDPVEGLLAMWEALRQKATGTNASGRVLRARAHTVEVKPESKRLVEIDGSVIGATPVSASIVPDGLIVLCPAKA